MFGNFIVRCSCGDELDGFDTEKDANQYIDRETEILQSLNEPKVDMSKHIFTVIEPSSNG